MLGAGSSAVQVILVSPPPVRTEIPVVIRGQVHQAMQLYGHLLERSVQASVGQSVDRFQHAFSPVPIFHYGLLSLAGHLRAAGYPARFVWGRSEHDIISSVADLLRQHSGPTVVGLTSVTPSWPAVVRIVRGIRRASPDAVVVVGGPHATYAAERCAVEARVDHLVKFAGEESLLEIVRSVSDGYRRDIGEVAPETGPSVCLVGTAPPAVAPEPDYSVLSLDEIRSFGSMVMGRRGCDRRCPFCVEGRLWHRREMTRPAEAVAREILFLGRTAGHAMVHIADSAFTADLAYATQVLTTLQSQPNPPAVTVNAHLEDLRDPATLDILSHPLVAEVLLGIETLSDAGQLAINRKHMPFEEIEYLLAGLRERTNKLISGYTMFGLPGEDVKAVKQSGDRLASLLRAKLVDFTLPKFFVPYPGTPFFEHPERYGLHLDDTDLSRFERWNSPRVISGSVPADAEVMDIMNAVLEEQRTVHA